MYNSTTQALSQSIVLGSFSFSNADLTNSIDASSPVRPNVFDGLAGFQQLMPLDYTSTGLEPSPELNILATKYMYTTTYKDVLMEEQNSGASSDPSGRYREIVLNSPATDLLSEPVITFNPNSGEVMTSIPSVYVRSPQYPTAVTG